MPYCPECKSIYKTGVEMCKGCGKKLLLGLENDKGEEMTLLLYSSDKDNAEEIADYLTWIGIPVKNVFVKEMNAYGTFVCAKDLNDASSAYNGLMKSKMRNEILGILDILDKE